MYKQSQVILGHLFIITVSFVLITIFSCYPIDTVKFTCQRESDNQIICTKKTFSGYGLLTNSVVKFSLIDFVFEENVKQVCNFGEYEYSRDGSRQGSEFRRRLSGCKNHQIEVYSYKIFLKSLFRNQKKLFFNSIPHLL